MKVTAIMDDSIPKEKVKEAMAIQTAVLTGACNTCFYLPQCESDSSFKFPADAACMRILNSGN